MIQRLPDWMPYCGVAPTPAAWWQAWNLDPVLIATLAAISALYGRLGPNDTRARCAAASALFVTAILFISPFCALGSALFTARAVHHVLLATVLAPLLVAAFRIRIATGSLALWTAVQILVFWGWHAPPAYGAALASDALFWTMQLSITLSAVIWWARMRNADAGSAVLSLLATMVQMGLLGAILTFAGRPLYDPHWLTTQSWGLSPLEDQQIAGLVMWAPASAIYLLCALTLLYRSLPAEPVRADAS